MPRTFVYLAPNVRVSVKPLYLRRIGVLEALQGLVDTSAPGIKFYATTCQKNVVEGRRKFDLIFDLLLDRTFTVDGGCLKFEGVRNRQQRGNVVETTNVDVSQGMEEDPELLDGVIEEITEEEDQVEAENAEEEVDLFWKAVKQTTYDCLSRPEDAFHGRCSIRVPRGLSLARYFVAFLPICHIFVVSKE